MVLSPSAPDEPGQPEARYRALFENMMDGVAYGRVLYDENGAAVDFLHLAVNPSFERVTGLSKVVGQRVSQLPPKLTAHLGGVLGALGRVAAGGPAERFEVDLGPGSRVLEIGVIGAEPGFALAIFADVTARKQAGWQAEADRARLETILGTVPLGVFLVEGPHGIITYINQHAQDAYGFQSVGLTVEENLRIVRARAADGSPLPPDDVPSRRALRGEHVRDEEMILERPDGTTYRVLTSASPLPVAAGRPAAAVVAFVDITELKRGENALRRSEGRLKQELQTTRILLHVAGSLAEWTDLQSVLRGLTEAVVDATPHTRATFALWDEAKREARIVISSGASPIPQFSAPVEDFSPAFQRAVATMQTAVVDYDSLPPERKRFADTVGSRNAVLVPLVYHRRLVGGLYVDDPGVRTDFNPDEIRLFEGIASQAAVAIENARLFEAQSNIASTLQQALLEMPAQIPGIRFSHLYHSATEQASVGGDFYDVLKLADDGYLLLIGDVSGHGIEAARSATFVRDAVAVFASVGRDPNEILTDANAALLRRGFSGFVSVVLAVISTDRRRLSFCSAGHPHFVIRRAHGGAMLAGSQHSSPLGVFPDWSCTLEGASLAQGDVMLFYTDGVTEARFGNELFGEERLLKWARTTGQVALSELPSALLTEILGFTGGPLQDDLAILAVEIDGAA